MYAIDRRRTRKRHTTTIAILDTSNDGGLGLYGFLAETSNSVMVKVKSVY